MSKINFKILIFLLILLIFIEAGLIFFVFYKSEQRVNLTDLERLQAVKNLNQLKVKEDETVSVVENNKKLPENEEVDNFLSFLFFGDVMLDRSVKMQIEKHGLDYVFTSFFEENKDLFIGSDFVSINLEGAVTKDGDHYPPINLYDFAFAPDIIRELKRYYFNFINLANNHLADQGERGILETRENLDNLGFYYSGCKDGQVGDCSSKIVEIKNKKIGFVGFSMVYSLPDQNEMNKIIKEVASSSDYLIVNIHWGQEYDNYFNNTQKMVAHNLIDSGADIIIGHHPHVIQGFEIYKDKPIFYSLGNFVFDQYFSKETQEGVAIQLELGEKNIVKLIPYKSHLSQVISLSNEEYDVFMNNYIKWSDVDVLVEKDLEDGDFILN